MYLLDPSAYLQGMLTDAARERLGELVRTNQVAICSPAMLEVLYLARGGRQWREMREELTLLPRPELTNPVDAVELQGVLARRRGGHRVPIGDVLVTATAAEHGLTVHNHDRTIERLADAVGASHEWIIQPRCQSGGAVEINIHIPDISDMSGGAAPPD